MTAPTTPRIDRWDLQRWEGGPTGHAVDIGTIVFESGTDHIVWADPDVLRIASADLGDTFTREEFLFRFRGGQVSNAYGNPYAVPLTPGGYPITSLGLQAEAWKSIYGGRTDCRTDGETR